ncbi:hypothetical protein MAR_005003 [Mya arenaria]|uniref:Uncharacterized protein n=1 Tax=Mya arenaria TaxID=6604 RepID=A0ABY7EY85_MYAAR|nr:hypothetical protein MAR_005003 [Mya arenaria]
MALWQDWIKSARQPRLRLPPPPGSRAFIEYFISLMSQWLYDRTAGLRVPDSRFSNHGLLPAPERFWMFPSH